MDTPDTTPDPATLPADAPAANPGESADPGARRPDGLPVGRPFQAGAPSANPSGRPRDPFAALIRTATKDGAEVVDFLLACMRDELDGRVADKAGLLDKMEAEADVIMGKVRAMQRDAKGDPEATIQIAKLVGEMTAEADDLRAKAKALRARLSKRRKIPVAVKHRQAAAAMLLDRGWGKAVERVDVKLGGDGTPIGVPNAEAPGALANLTTADLAEIGTVLERATKRATAVETPAEPAQEGAKS